MLPVPHDCPDACGVLITVEDGRATRIQGDPEHPVTRGFLCAKVAKYLDRVYSPERVLYPMRRVAPKGPAAKIRSGGQPMRCPYTWQCISQRISWDEALDEIASRFRAIADRIWAVKRSCPTPTAARSARSTAGPWTGVFSTVWERRNWIAPSARRRARLA